MIPSLLKSESQLLDALPEGVLVLAGKAYEVGSIC